MGRANCLLSFHYILIIGYDTDRIENTAYNKSSIVACVFVTAGTCSLSRCLVQPSGHTNPAFRRRVTLLPSCGCSSRVAYRRTAISSSPRRSASHVY
jgi:hypothetical protein